MFFESLEQRAASTRQMPSGLKKFLLSWLINTLAVLVAVKIVSGLNYQKPLDLFVASLLLGILNAVIRPILYLLTLPLVLVTLGLFTLVINAVLLYFVGYLMKPSFEVAGFSSAFWGAVVIWIISTILNAIAGIGGGRVRIQSRRRPPDSEPPGKGPVIDV
jgi:putative membrane protein